MLVEPCEKKWEMRKTSLEKTFLRKPYTPTPPVVQSVEIQKLVTFLNMREPYTTPTPEPEFSVLWMQKKCRVGVGVV